MNATNGDVYVIGHQSVSIHSVMNIELTAQSSIHLRGITTYCDDKFEIHKEGGSSTYFVFDSTTQDEQNLILRDQEGKEIDFNFGRDTIISDLDLIVSKIGRSSSYMCSLPSKSSTLATTDDIAQSSISISVRSNKNTTLTSIGVPDHSICVYWNLKGNYNANNEL